jgi:hypothetical protein
MVLSVCQYNNDRPTCSSRGYRSSLNQEIKQIHSKM